MPWRVHGRSRTGSTQSCSFPTSDVGGYVVTFGPDQRHGNRAPFLRNESIVKLNPVEAIIGEGSGIQSNLAQRLRQAGVPLHIRRISDQAQVRSRNLG